MERAIDRFDFYMKSAGLNDNKVTVQLGLTVGVIGKSRKEGRDLSRSTIKKILATYTDLNPNWLLTGEGPMLISDAKPEGAVKPQQTSNGSLVEYLQRKIAELEGKIDKLNEEKADLLQENAVLKYENMMLAPQKGKDAEDVDTFLSADVV